MNDLEMLKLCKWAHSNTDVNGWKTLHQYETISQNKQFNVKVYQKGKIVVLAFAGTNLLEGNDWNNDWQIMGKSKIPGFSDIPTQFWETARLYFPQHKTWPKTWTGFIIIT